MAGSLSEVLVKRERLLASIAAQREGVRHAVGGLAGPIALIDRVAQAGRFLRAHPFAVGAAVAVLVAMRTRSLVGLLARGFGAWRLLRRIQSLLARHGI